MRLNPAARIPSTVQNRRIFKSTTNKGMLLLSWYQKFTLNVIIGKVGRYNIEFIIQKVTFLIKIYLFRKQIVVR